MISKRARQPGRLAFPALAFALITKAASAAAVFSWFSSRAPAPPPVEPAASPGLQCRDAIRAIERSAGIPPPLMTAIAHVESGRRTPGGEVDPWPWSLNAEGTDHVYETKAEAVAAVKQMRRAGMRSIDVGCMQVNLMYHPDAFTTLDEAFDPVSNARYAASFLLSLRAQTGNWPQATADYHSATPELGADYARKVMAVMGEEALHDPPTSAWASVEPRLAQPGSLRMAAAGQMATAAAMPAGGGHGAIMLSQHLTLARMPQMPSPVGRNLAAYRGSPIQLAWRPPQIHPALP